MKSKNKDSLSNSQVKNNSNKDKKDNINQAKIGCTGSGPKLGDLPNDGLVQVVEKGIKK